jgi:hypothetical protein
LARTAAAAETPTPVSAPALPGPGSPGHWSTVTGETVSPDHDALSFQLGWPGASFTYLHGLSDRSDMGVELDFLYSFENTSNATFGFGAGVPLRLVVNRSSRVLVGLRLDPGIRLYTKNSVTNFMTRFPVGGIIGLQVTPALRLAVTADLTLAINWTHTSFFEIGPQFGFGADYLIDRNLIVGLNARFGPQFYTLSGSPSDFAFTTVIVVGYRM